MAVVVVASKRDFSEFRSAQSAFVTTRSQLRAKRARVGLQDEAAELQAVTRASELALIAGTSVRKSLRPMPPVKAADRALLTGVHRAFVAQTLPYGGNGSLRPAALMRVLDSMKLDRDSVFLDLGCGAGNVLLFALIGYGVRAAVGLEYDAPTITLGRSIVARQIAHLAPALRDVGRVQLLDADLGRLQRLSSDITAVYAYDRVMNRGVLRNVAKLLNALRPRTFVSFVRPAEWATLGLVAQHVGTIEDCATTGAQSFTGYRFEFA